MSAERVFVDTNVLTYLFDDAEPEKQAAAQKRLEHESDEREIVISTQILQELYVSLTKGKHPIAVEDVAERAVRDAAGFRVIPIDVPMVLSAIAVSRRNAIGFWDALVVIAAAQAGCAVLLTEDLNHGQILEGVRVDNPFRAREDPAAR